MHWLQLAGLVTTAALLIIEPPMSEVCWRNTWKWQSDSGYFIHRMTDPSSSILSKATGDYFAHQRVPRRPVTVKAICFELGCGGHQRNTKGVEIF
jgi:hypothetical protein